MAAVDMCLNTAPVQCRFCVPVTLRRTVRIPAPCLHYLLSQHNKWLQFLPTGSAIHSYFLELFWAGQVLKVLQQPYIVVTNYAAKLKWEQMSRLCNSYHCCGSACYFSVFRPILVLFTWCSDALFAPSSQRIENNSPIPQFFYIKKPVGNVEWRRHLMFWIISFNTRWYGN